MRMNGLSAVNPDSVTGQVSINGVTYGYKRGRMVVNGEPLMVSDDKDLVIRAGNHQVYGYIVGGVLKQAKDLPSTLLSAIHKKYGLS